MLPYIEHPEIPVGPVAIPAFWLLVCLAVLVGYEIVVRRAERFGLERAAVSQIAAWTILGGFIGSHVFEELTYSPELVREDPLRLLWFWGSMSSVGGMAGGILGGLVSMHRRRLSREEILRFLDLFAFAAPFGWSFGRLGCALAHDHLGVESTHWLAVRFPSGSRFDLGLLEFFFLVAFSGLFAALARRPRATGFYLGLFFMVYGVVRFGLDMLRVGEARYLGWTPAQFACVAAALAGAGLLVLALRRRRSAAR